MSWRRSSRVVIVVVTLAVVGIALLAGHVSKVPRTTVPARSSAPVHVCLRVTASVPGHKAAIKCR